MASRRTRIKGIANIPQRRKNTTGEEQASQVKLENANDNSNLTFNIDKILEDKELHLQPNPCIIIKSEEKSGDIIQNLQNCNGDVEQNSSACDNNYTASANTTALRDVKNEIDYENKVNIQDNSKLDKSNVSQSQQSKLFIRRKYIKPSVSIGTVNRKCKQNIDKEGSDKFQSVASEVDQSRNVCNDKEIYGLEKTVISPQNTLNPSKTSDSKVVQNIQGTTSSLHSSTEIILDETHLTTQNETSPTEKDLKKLVSPSVNHCVDLEYPPPPPSPSKINRSRIKAIPRLSYRKASFSASESEDESKRNNSNRNRNDSVCSTASGITEAPAECMSPQRPKEFSSIIQKKCNRTEQSRKLAEARREFQRRFGSNKPDRQRLTMIDLIFYNPTTNPMTENMKSKQVEFAQDTVESQVENEMVDDPEAATDAAGKSDEENEMPVPQIKIGPSGEIVLDEKSLVIESKEVKKQREELQKTQLVDGDFSTTYGVYKRHKRSKGWTANETLRFYKALNSIGTDFTLMCELFPRRSRRELKMKFKKEEKINRSLINKAIMQPCSFQFAELKQETDMEEKELEELQRQKEDEAKLKKTKSIERVPKKRKARKKETPARKKDETGDEPSPKPPKIRRTRKPRVPKLSIESVLEDSDADESDVATHSESEDEEISMPLRATRSGRIPKVTKKFDHTEPMTVDHVVKSSTAPNVKPNDIEPGSIMIITEKGLNGEPVYKIYMVTPDQNATPLNLTSDVVSKAIEFKKGLTAQNIMTISADVTDDKVKKGGVTENNVTIPADENVTTLKENSSLPPGSVDLGTPKLENDVDMSVDNTL